MHPGPRAVSVRQASIGGVGVPPSDSRQDDGANITTLRADTRDRRMVFQASRQGHRVRASAAPLALTQRRSTAGDTLGVLGRAAEAGRYAHQISGGKQQRMTVALVSAIAQTLSGRCMTGGLSIRISPSTPLASAGHGIDDRASTGSKST